MLKNLTILARPAQWLKNGVVLAALVFAGEATQTGAVELALLAMAVFCLLSSAVYTINDLIDQDRDRQHPLKRERPLASGKLAATPAIVMTLLLIVASLGIAWTVGWSFFVIAILFLVLNLLYSLLLKEIVIVDVMTIAIGFVLRAYAGAADND